MSFIYRNILRVPALWSDTNSNNPPSSFDSTTGLYHLTGAVSGSTFSLTSDNTVEKQLGDYIAFEVVNHSADELTIDIVVDGTTVHSMQIVGGKMAAFIGEALGPHSSVALNFSSNSGNDLYNADFEISPLSLGTNESFIDFTVESPDSHTINTASKNDLLADLTGPGYTEKWEMPDGSTTTAATATYDYGTTENFPGQGYVKYIVQANDNSVTYTRIKGFTTLTQVGGGDLTQPAMSLTDTVSGQLVTINDATTYSNPVAYGLIGTAQGMQYQASPNYAAVPPVLAVYNYNGNYAGTDKLRVATVDNTNQLATDLLPVTVAAAADTGIKNIFRNPDHFNDAGSIWPNTYDAQRALYTLDGSLLTTAEATATDLVITSQAGAIADGDYFAFEVVSTNSAANISITVKINGTVEASLPLTLNDVLGYISGKLVSTDSVEVTIHSSTTLADAKVIFSPTSADYAHGFLTPGLSTGGTNGTVLSGSLVSRIDGAGVATAQQMWLFSGTPATGQTASHDYGSVQVNPVWVAASAQLANGAVYSRLMSALINGTTSPQADQASQIAPVVQTRGLRRLLQDNSLYANGATPKLVFVDPGTGDIQYNANGLISTGALSLPTAFASYLYPNTDTNYQIRTAVVDSNNRMSLATFSDHVTPGAAPMFATAEGLVAQANSGLYISSDGKTLTGETITGIQFNWGDNANWDDALLEYPASDVIDHFVNVSGYHTYTAGGTYTVTMRVYTQEAGTTPYTYTTSVTASALTTPDFTASVNNDTVTLTDNTVYAVNDATNGVPAGEIAFSDRAWLIYGPDNVFVSSDPTTFRENYDTITDQAQTSTNFTLPGQGDYTAVLVVDAITGAQGSQSYPMITITKKFTVAPPVTPTAPDFTFNATGLTVSFTDTTTTDPSATATSWLWDFGDGQTSTVHNPTHVYGTAGTYPVTLTVGDSTGATTPVQHSLTVSPTIQPTQPAFTISGSGASFSFNDTTTTDPTITVSSVQWDFGDGQISTLANPTHVYTASGSYVVTLSVTDSTGAVTTTTRTVIATVANTSDTYSLKGFVAYGAMSDNVPEEVALLGELSLRSGTYAKDRALYATTAGTAPSSTAVNLSVFSSKQSDGSDAAIPVDYTTTLLAIGKWIYEQSLSGQFSSDNNAFLQALLSEFSGQIKDVVVGSMLQQGTQWMPESITFHFTSASADQPSYTSITRVKLWFSDHSFATQYDEYLIEFVTPLPDGSPLDDFFKPSSQVATEVESVTLPDLMQQVQTVIGNDPPTMVKTLNFDYHDPNDASYTHPTNWTFIIYGQAGNNIDAIKARLIEYILANSTHSREDWAKIFPDIFTSTEYIITPLWNQYAIPNETVDMGVYSPTVSVARAQQIAPSVFVGTKYTQDHINANMSVMGVPYKSLGMIVCGGPDNRDGITQFEHQWPDYIAVPTSSLDFDRMSPDTQSFVSLLYQLLKIAEDMTEFSDIPINFTRLKRTNPSGVDVLYVVATYQDIQYLVVAKSWLNAIFPPPAALNMAQPSTSTISVPANGGAVTVNFQAAGGLSPYEYVLMSSDSRFTNVSLNSATGEFKATLPTWGNYPLTVKVVDHTGDSIMVTYTIASPAGA